MRIEPDAGDAGGEVGDPLDCGHRQDRGDPRDCGDPRDAGQGLVEYGLILGLGALVMVVALVFFGGALAAALSLLGQAIDAAS